MKTTPRILSLLMMVLVGLLMGCSTITDSKPLGRHWLVPPVIDPETKEVIHEGIEYVAFENKSNNPDGQDLLAHREFVLNHQTRKIKAFDPLASGGAGIHKGVMVGTGAAVVDGVFGIPQALLFGHSIRPAQSTFSVENGNDVQTTTSGGSIASGAVSTDVDVDANAHAKNGDVKGDIKTGPVGVATNVKTGDNTLSSSQDTKTGAVDVKTGATNVSTSQDNNQHASNTANNKAGAKGGAGGNGGGAQANASQSQDQKATGGKSDQSQGQSQDQKAQAQQQQEQAQKAKAQQEQNQRAKAQQKQGQGQGQKQGQSSNADASVSNDTGGNWDD